MRTGMNVRPSARQRGWAGLVMILVALAIVAFLAKDALKGYGLGSRPDVVTKAATPAARARPWGWRRRGAGPRLGAGGAGVSARAGARRRGHDQAAGGRAGGACRCRCQVMPVLRHA